MYARVLNIALNPNKVEAFIQVYNEAIIPFAQQQNHSFTYGTNFVLENFNQTTTRNFRFSLAYAFRKTSTTKPKTKGSSGKEKLDKVLSGS